MRLGTPRADDLLAGVIVPVVALAAKAMLEHNCAVAPATGACRIGFSVAGTRRERRCASHHDRDEDGPRVQPIHLLAHRDVEVDEAFECGFGEGALRW